MFSVVPTTRNSSTTHRSRTTTREKWTVTWFWSCAVAYLSVAVVRSRRILNSLLARITTTVLICILPRVAALILVAMSGAIFTILPTANYIIMLPAVRYYNRKVEDRFITAIARNTTTREESCQGHVCYFCCSWHLCDSKNCGCCLFSVVWQPLP